MLVRLNGQLKHSMVNGPGCRWVIFMQGCPHDCAGCHNPNTHDIKGGFVADTDFIPLAIYNTKHIDGVTISGGEPFMQAEALLDLLQGLKYHLFNVWVYTGYTYEEILNGKLGNIAKSCLHYIDVLVDGPFVQELKSDECIWRGSTNQRLIDVQKSRKARSVCLLGDPHTAAVVP